MRMRWECGDRRAFPGRIIRHSSACRLIEAALPEWRVAALDSVGGYAHADPVIRFSPRVHEAANELREFMFRRVYLYDSTRREAERGKRIVLFLFEHFVRNPEGISPGYSLPGDPLERRAADFVSGMTDRYAIRLGGELGCPDAEGWRV